MNVRRQKLTQSIALQTAVMAPRDTGEGIADLRTFPVREPDSGRAYTVVRLRTRAGITGYGECGRVSASETESARAALMGRPATAYAVLTTATALDGAINMALLDITAKACAAPVYRLLGGPTRFKARVLTSLEGSTDAALATGLAGAMKAGYQALQVPLPPVTARNQGQAFDRAIRARMDSLRSAAGGNIDFVLDGAGALTAGDSATAAASLERFHLLWLNEPCPVMNLRTIRKISEETVTPLGFGRDVREPSFFQDLLREGVADVLRPNLHVHGISRIRGIAALAETYYVAIAPDHNGGPVATAAALHLAASLPNFFIQHIPFPRTEADRRMRLDLVTQPVEAVHEGFARLPDGPGLGIEVNERALEKYKDNTA